MIEALISSKTRIKLLLKLFLNPENSAHLRGLAEEFNESTNAIRMELNRFEQADMLTSEKQGNRKIFRANKSHPLFSDVHNIILKMVGIDHIINFIIGKLGELKQVYLTGDLANGINSDIIDIIIVGKVNKTYLVELVEKAEQKINRRIRYLTFLPGEFKIPEDTKKKYVLIWNG